MKKLLIVLILICSMLFIGCKKEEAPTDNLVLDENQNFKKLNKVENLSEDKDNLEVEDEFVNSLYEFTNKTINKLYKEKNIVYSPISLYFALSMLYEATTNKARQELMQLLNINETNSLRNNLSSIYQNNFYKNDKGTGKIANSFWLNKEYEIEEDYAKILQDYYFAEAFSTNFDNDSLEKICKWINHQTGNLLNIKPNDLQLNNETALSLINTIYFNNKWKVEMKKENMYTALFNNKKEVKYLKHIIDSSYYINDKCKVAYDYYQNDNKIMYVLPNEGYTINDLLNDNIFALIGKKEYSQINLSVPKFDISSSLNFIQTLEELGVEEIFNDSTSDIKSIKGNDVFVNSIMQNARIILDEEGTKAAAVTKVDSFPTASNPNEIIDFKIDHSFIYVIFDAKDVPLFVGVVNEL